MPAADELEDRFIIIDAAGHLRGQSKSKRGAMMKAQKMALPRCLLVHVCCAHEIVALTPEEMH